MLRSGKTIRHKGFVVMGNKGRILRKIARKPPVRLIDTGLVFNNCKVFLGFSSDPNIIKKFGAWINRMMFRSRQTNMGDVYATHIAVGQKMAALKENENLFN